MFISFVWGVFGKGGFCPGGFCPGVYVRGVYVGGFFVLIPSYIYPCNGNPWNCLILCYPYYHGKIHTFRILITEGIRTSYLAHRSFEAAAIIHCATGGYGYLAILTTEIEIHNFPVLRYKGVTIGMQGGKQSKIVFFAIETLLP